MFAGSLPRGVDVDIYGRLIREVAPPRRHRVVDTDGDPLRRAVRAEPDVISPNVLEAEELVGHEFNDDEDYAARRARDGRARRARGDHDRARRLRRPGRCPTTGAPPRCFRATIPEVEEARRRSARATRSWPATSPPATRGRPRRGCLAYGVACGAESTQHLGAGVVDPAAGRAPARRGRGRRRLEARRGRLTAAHFPHVCGQTLRATPAASVGSSASRGVFPSAPTPRIPSWK